MNNNKNNLTISHKGNCILKENDCEKNDCEVCKALETKTKRKYRKFLMKNNFEGFELIKNDTFLNLTKEFYHENCVINNTVDDITFIFPHKCIDEYFKKPIENLNKFFETFSNKEIVDVDLISILPKCLVQKSFVKVQNWDHLLKLVDPNFTSNKLLFEKMGENALNFYYKRNLVRTSVEVVEKLVSSKIDLKILEQKVRKERALIYR